MNKKINTRNLVIASLLIALSVVFARVFSIRISEGLRISFAQTPIIISGLLLGPVWGLAVGALADLTGFVLFPMGAYLPGFTVISALVGFVPGIIRSNDKNSLMLQLFFICCRLPYHQRTINYILLFTSITSNGFMAWLAIRMPVQVVMTVVHSVVIIAVMAGLSRVLYNKKDNE